MILYLEGTTYNEFKAWLINKAGKYGFLMHYDESGLMTDIDIDHLIPDKVYPLRIFLSKIYNDGLAYDDDGVFIIEKVGSRLKICPKPFNDCGKKNLLPLLEELCKDWPENNYIGLDSSINLVPQKGKTGPKARNKANKIDAYRQWQKVKMNGEIILEDFLDEWFGPGEVSPSTFYGWKRYMIQKITKNS